MFKFTRKDNADGTKTITAEYTAKISDYAETKILRDSLDAIVAELSKNWIAKYGDALLDEIAPAEVEEAIKKQLAAKILL